MHVYIDVLYVLCLYTCIYIYAAYNSRFVEKKWILKLNHSMVLLSLLKVIEHKC